MWLMSLGLGLGGGRWGWLRFRGEDWEVGVREEWKRAGRA